MSNLPPAPPITEEGIPLVCQSDIDVVDNNVLMHITFNVFVKSILSQIVIEHNRDSVCTVLEVDGKVEKQWDGLSLDEFSAAPYTFTVREQKFVLSWIVQQMGFSA